MRASHLCPTRPGPFMAPTCFRPTCSQARRDLNPQPPVLETGALPVELRTFNSCDEPGASSFGLLEWPGAESNRRHHDFQSCALPTELPGQKKPPEPFRARARHVPRRFLFSIGVAPPSAHPGETRCRPQAIPAPDPPGAPSARPSFHLPRQPASVPSSRSATAAQWRIVNVETPPGAALQYISIAGAGFEPATFGL
jgi:hypothetical protein